MSEKSWFRPKQTPGGLIVTNTDYVHMGNREDGCWHSTCGHGWSNAELVSSGAKQKCPRCVRVLEVQKAQPVKKKCSRCGRS